MHQSFGAVRVDPRLLDARQVILVPRPPVVRLAGKPASQFEDPRRSGDGLIVTSKVRQCDDLSKQRIPVRGYKRQCRVVRFERFRLLLAIAAQLREAGEDGRRFGECAARGGEAAERFLLIRLARNVNRVASEQEIDVGELRNRITHRCEVRRLRRTACSGPILDERHIVETLDSRRNGDVSIGNDVLTNQRQLEICTEQRRAGSGGQIRTPRGNGFR